MIDLSIIIPSYKRIELLQQCLDSIENSDIAIFSYEIIVIVNGFDPATSRTISNRKEIRKIQIPKSTPAAARNMAIESAEGEYLLFIDDDIVVPPNYFSIAKDSIQQEHKIFGGPDQVFPNADFGEKVVALSLASPAGTAHTYKRHFRSRKFDGKLCGENSLSLCNLWIKKSLFEKFRIRFNEEYFRNEENVLLQRFQDLKIESSYHEKLYVFHRRHKKISRLVSAFFDSGYYRIKSIIEFPKITKFIYFAPLFALILIPGLVLSGLIFKSFILYFFALISINLVCLCQRQSNAVLALVPITLLQMVMHLSYAIGSLTILSETLLTKVIKKFESRRTQYLRF